jgi:hypothetical protein
MDKDKVAKWLGVACHVVVGAVMVLACGLKALGMAPKPIMEGLTRFGLAEQVRLIGAGGLVAAVLLLVPKTWRLGALVASAYWGGAIALHMGQHESYTPPAVLLVLTWLGAVLRDPAAVGWLGRGADRAVS